MDTSMQFCGTAIARIRAYLDDPSVDAKYDDAFVMQHVVCPALASVVSRINNSTAGAVSMWIPFPLTTSQTDYLLPPCCGEVWRLSVRDSDGTLRMDARPRTEHHSDGCNFQVQGNMLHFLPAPDKDYPDAELQFMHSGECSPFVGSGTLSAGKDSISFPLASTPSVGVVDRRPSAYAGCVARLPTSTGVVEERIVESWEVDGTDFVATLRTAFTHASAGTVSFEMAPLGLESAYEAVSLLGAMKLGAMRRISQAHMQMLTLQYRDAMKTCLDHWANRQTRTGKYFERATFDNPENRWQRL